jgi:MerR family transcriptional regulator, light-induced transcriptional regulator
MTVSTHGSQDLSRTKRQKTRDPVLPISAVERDIGVAKETLRVWERRYGFPRPLRDALGERQYSAAEIDKLRLIKRLIDSGHRPGKLVPLPMPELLRLEGKSAAQAARAGSTSPPLELRADLDEYLQLVKAHQIDVLRSRFAQAILRLGIARFVDSVIGPLNERVGDAWTRGEFEVFEEHLYTEAVHVVLRKAIDAIPTAAARPNVLLTTFPQESHGIGILMAEAILSLEGCRCVSLGTRTPVRDIVLAANAHRSDIVALSFSSSLARNPVLAGIVELQSKLPAATEIWAGGACQALHRRPPAHVKTFKLLSEIAPALVQWRAAHLGLQDAIR